MKNYSTRTNRTKTTRGAKAATGSVSFTQWNAADCAEEILFAHRPTVDSINSIIKHPRSLARPLATWRPPKKELPGIGDSGPLSLTVTRHRVGPRAVARVRGYGEDRTPVYLISVRMTDPVGFMVNPDVAEGWVRALVNNNQVNAIHEIASGDATTFVWLVDRDYQPVLSPNSLFVGMSNAA